VYPDSEVDISVISPLNSRVVTTIESEVVKASIEFEVVKVTIFS